MYVLRVPPGSERCNLHKCYYYLLLPPTITGYLNTQWRCLISTRCTYELSLTMGGGSENRSSGQPGRVVQLYHTKARLWIEERLQAAEARWWDGWERGYQSLKLPNWHTWSGTGRPHLGNYYIVQTADHWSASSEEGRKTNVSAEWPT